MKLELGLMLAGVLGIGFLAQWLAWRLRLPAILFLLLAGILLGPVGGVLYPDRLLGELLFPVVSLAVALILFEGSLSLRFHELPGIGRVVRGLVSYGAVVAMALLAAAAHYFAGLRWDRPGAAAGGCAGRERARRLSDPHPLRSEGRQGRPRRPSRQPPCRRCANSIRPRWRAWPGGTEPPRWSPSARWSRTGPAGSPG